MSRTIKKSQVAKEKVRMPKMEKGTKTTMRVKYLRELEEED